MSSCVKSRSGSRSSSSPRDSNVRLEGTVSSENSLLLFFGGRLSDMSGSRVSSAVRFKLMYSTSGISYRRSKPHLDMRSCRARRAAE